MSYTNQVPLSTTPRSRSLTRPLHPPSRSPRSLSRSRPTTPLRASSRNSLRSSRSNPATSDAPLEVFEQGFAELSDSMADLEANFMHLQLMHESLARFSEGFASFLYGLSVNAFCVDFPEAPVQESFRRARDKAHEDSQMGSGIGRGRATSNERHGDAFDGETTFMTTDTSFVDNPPTTVSSKSQATPKKLVTPRPATRTTGAPGRGGAIGRGGARGGARGGRVSGLPAPRGRGSSLPSRTSRS